MDNSMDPAIEVAALRGQIAGLRSELANAREEIAVLKGLAVIEQRERDRLRRLLTEATYGADARSAKATVGTRASDVSTCGATSR